MSSSLVPLALSTPKPLNVRPFRLLGLMLLPSSVIAVGALPLFAGQVTGAIEPPCPASPPRPTLGVPPTPDPAPPIVASPPLSAPPAGSELPLEPPAPPDAEPPVWNEPPVDEPVPAPAMSGLWGAPLPHDNTSQARQTQRNSPVGDRTEAFILRVFAGRTPLLTGTTPICEEFGQGAVLPLQDSMWARKSSMKRVAVADAGVRRQTAQIIVLIAGSSGTTDTPRKPSWRIERGRQATPTPAAAKANAASMLSTCTVTFGSKPAAAQSSRDRKSTCGSSRWSKNTID